MDYIALMKTEQERIEFYMQHAPEKFKKEEFVEHLKKKGYFKKPYAAVGTDVVNNYLFEHNWNVTNAFRDFCQTYSCNLQDENSWFLIGMFYNYYLLDCVNEIANGQYMIDLKYFMRANVLGEITIAELSLFFDLTDEEKECLRWHRGMYDYTPDGYRFLMKIHEYPAIFALQTAEVFLSHVIDWQDNGNRTEMVGYR